MNPIDHLRIRHDTVGQFGKLTLRYGSRLHHLGIEPRAGTNVLILITTTTVVISTTGHHAFASHHIDPAATIGATNRKTPADGRGKPSPMTRLMCDP